MLYTALLVVVAIGLCSGYEVNGGLEHDIHELQSKLHGLEERVESLSHGVCPQKPLNLHIYGDAREGEHHGSEHDLNINLNLHVAEDHQKDDHVEDEHDQHDGEIVYAHCSFEPVEESSEIHGHILIKKHPHERAEMLVDLFNIPDHNAEHDLSVHEIGYTGDHCSHIGDEVDDHHFHVTTDEFGHVNEKFTLDHFHLLGADSVLGRAIAIDDHTHDHPIACCGLTRTSKEVYDAEHAEDIHEEEELHKHADEHHAKKRSVVNPKLLVKH